MIGRRDFLRGKLSRSPTQSTNLPIRWVRPPFALQEPEFLAACTRCGDCVEACPYDVVFPLGAALGDAVAETPALDLLHKGCHLCTDWPCVAACEPNALLRSQDADEISNGPVLAWVQIDADACLPYLGPECAAYFQTAMDMMVDGRASDLGAMVMPRMPWDQAPEAFEMYANCAKDSLKLTLEL